MLKSIYEATLPILSQTPPSWLQQDGTLVEHDSDIKRVALSFEILMEHEEVAQTMQELASLISDQNVLTSLSTSSSPNTLL